jgi:hypothetical protein
VGESAALDIQFRFRVGRDRLGRWVVEDDRGLRGGLFISRAEALKFALFESGHRSQAITIVDGVFEPDPKRSALRMAAQARRNTWRTRAALE